MKNKYFKTITRSFHEVLEFIAQAPESAKKIYALKNNAQHKKIKLAFVDASALHEELAQSGTRWNAAQCPMGAAFFHGRETVVMILKEQELALSALILVHELAHVRDFQYMLDREQQIRLASDLKRFGLDLINRHKAGYKVLPKDFSDLEARRKEFDWFQNNTVLKAEHVAFEETRLFIDEIHRSQKIDTEAWSFYLAELRQKGHALFPQPGEKLTEELIKDRYLAA